MSVDPGTVDFAVNGLIVIATLCAGIVAPLGGLVLFSKVAVRLASPLIESELIKSQSFMVHVGQVAEHKAKNEQAKLLGAYEVMIERLKIVETLAKDVNEIKLAIAELHGRTERH